MSINIEDVLGQPAIFQILNKKRGRTEEEKRVLALKIEASCKRFNNNQGRLSVDEFYNVIKLQNGVEVSKDELRRLVADLEMDKHFKVSIKDFMKEPIISQDVFLAIDKNKDGYVSRGELKLAQRNLSLTQVNAIIDELDVNGDGKLTFDEVKQVALKVKDQAKVSKSKKSNR